MELKQEQETIGQPIDVDAEVDAMMAGYDRMFSVLGGSGMCAKLRHHIPETRPAIKQIVGSITLGKDAEGNIVATLQGDYIGLAKAISKRPGSLRARGSWPGGRRRAWLWPCREGPWPRPRACRRESDGLCAGNGCRTFRAIASQPSFGQDGR